MGPLAISLVIFGCIVLGLTAGVILGAVMPKHHVSAESKNVINLSMGLIGTMTALVLGLLVASAKGTFDTQRAGLAQMAGNVIFLDRALARYGPESQDARATIKAAVVDMLATTWPNESTHEGVKGPPAQTEGRYEYVFDKLQALTPKTEAQRTLRAEAVKIATDIGQSRWILFAQKDGSIPTPLLVVLVCWLALLLASFGLFAPHNVTVYITLLICALVVSSSIFLILELDQPLQGMLQISSAPLRGALAQMGH